MNRIQFILVAALLLIIGYLLGADVPEASGPREVSACR